MSVGTELRIIIGDFNADIQFLIWPNIPIKFMHIIFILMQIIVAHLNSNYNWKLHYLLQLLIFFAQLRLFSFKHYYYITFVCITQSSLLFLLSSNPNNTMKHLLKFSLMKGVPSFSVPQTRVISRYQELTRYTNMTKSAISDSYSWDQTCRWRLPQYNPCQMQDSALHLPTQ
jgi:hypothetical protein